MVKVMFRLARTALSHMERISSRLLQLQLGALELVVIELHTGETPLYKGNTLL